MKTEPTHQGSATLGEDMAKIWEVLRENRGFILLCVVGFGALGFAYTKISHPRYAASAVIEVEAAESKVLKIEETDPDKLKGVEVMKTMEQKLTSPALLTRVIERNNLIGDPEFLPGIKRPASMGVLRGAFEKNITATVRRGTRLIDVKVQERSARMAHRLADLLVQEFMVAVQEDRTDAAVKASSFLAREATRLSQKLAQSERALQEYKEQHNALSLEEKQNIVVEKLKELSTRVTAANAERLKLEADYALASSGQNPPAKLLEIPSVLALPEVTELQKRITDTAARVATLEQRYQPDHPKLVAAKSELLALKDGLNSFLDNAGERLGSACEAARQTEAKLRLALADQEKAALELSNLALRYNPLVREVETDRALFDSVSAASKQVEVIHSVAQNAVRVISSPIWPDKPESPKKGRILFVSLLGGMLMGCGGSLLRRATDRSIRTVSEGERLLGVPCLGVIPNGRSSSRAESLTGEAFRSLRTSLMLKGANDRVYIMASGEAAEGKTYCASQCAVAFGQMGLRTLLVDADLRSNVDGSGLSTQINAKPGLADYLRGEAQIKEVLQPSKWENLSVIAAGKNVENASELLSMGGFSRLLEETKGKFDRIIVDTPPVNQVSDALLLFAAAHRICLVIHAGRTSDESALRCCKKIKESGFEPAGFIFNAAPVAKGQTPYRTPRGSSAVERLARETARR